MIEILIIEILNLSTIMNLNTARALELLVKKTRYFLIRFLRKVRELIENAVNLFIYLLM